MVMDVFNYLVIKFNGSCNKKEKRVNYSCTYLISSNIFFNTFIAYIYKEE